LPPPTAPLFPSTTLFRSQGATRMQTKSFLTVADVDTLLAAARDEARRNQWIVSIAVVDDGGHPLGQIRLDGATAFSAYMSMEKRSEEHTSELQSREKLVC